MARPRLAEKLKDIVVHLLELGLHSLHSLQLQLGPAWLLGREVEVKKRSALSGKEFRLVDVDLVDVVIG